MRGKRSRLSASCRMLDRRSLHLEESLRHHEVPSCPPEVALAHEHRTQCIVHSHIEISLAVALIIVLHTVELLRQGTDRLGEKSKLLREERELSLVCVEEFSTYADKVTEVDKLLCELVGGDWLCFT
jgi:hypothetical protein